MKYCPDCEARVEGDWENCPLCGTSLEITNPQHSKDPFPIVPLKFNRRQAIALLARTSFLLVLVYFILEILSSTQSQWLEYLLLGILSMWLVVYIFIRKRRNLAKGMVYLLVFLGLLSAYFDYLSGWQGWSISYAIPTICGASLIAIMIVIRVSRMAVGDYVLYLELAAILGFFPGLFIFMNLTTVNWPSWICIGLSAVTLLVVSLRHRKAILQELTKRMDL